MLMKSKILKTLVCPNMTREHLVFDENSLKSVRAVPRHLDDLAAYEDQATLREFQACHQMPPPIRSRGDDEDQLEVQLPPRGQKRGRQLSRQKEFSVNRIRDQRVPTGDGAMTVTATTVEEETEPPEPKGSPQPPNKRNRQSKSPQPPQSTCAKVGQGTHVDPFVLEDSDEEIKVIPQKQNPRVSGKPKLGFPRDPFDQEENFQVSSTEEFEATGTKVMMRRSISDHLLPHQREAVQFMWKNTMEGILSWKPHESGATAAPVGSGCILAHCMGSGKTLSTLSFVATMLSNPTIAHLREPNSNHSLIYRVLIICPVNVLVNWGIEFQRWIPQECRIKHYTVDANLKRASRLEILQAWYNRGGVCIIGKELFCNLVEEAKKENCKERPENSLPAGNALTFLISPGPDIVVLDEAHTVKNSSSRLFNTLKDLRTQRRISLTGSPLQNNLRELWNMVEFAKSGHLFKWEKFCNLFLRPIEVPRLAFVTQLISFLRRAAQKTRPSTKCPR
jgi:hypothetical protein